MSDPVPHAVRRPTPVPLIEGLPVAVMSTLPPPQAKRPENSCLHTAAYDDDRGSARAAKETLYALAVQDGLFVDDSSDGGGAGSCGPHVSGVRDLRQAGTATAGVPDSSNRAAAVAGRRVAGVDGRVADRGGERLTEACNSAATPDCSVPSRRSSRASNSPATALPAVPAPRRQRLTAGASGLARCDRAARAPPSRARRHRGRPTPRHDAASRVRTRFPRPGPLPVRLLSPVPTPLIEAPSSWFRLVSGAGVPSRWGARAGRSGDR